SREVVKTTTGIVFNFGSPRIWRNTSKPFIRGILRSNRIRAGLPRVARELSVRRRRQSIACAPLCVTTTISAVPLAAMARTARSASLRLSSASRIHFSLFMGGGGIVAPGRAFTGRLLMGDCDIVDDDLAIGCGCVASARVGLRVAPGFEVAAGIARGISIDVLTIVVGFHPAVAYDEFHGEHGPQLIVRGQDGAG